MYSTNRGFFAHGKMDATSGDIHRALLPFGTGAQPPPLALAGAGGPLDHGGGDWHRWPSTCWGTRSPNAIVRLVK